MSFLFQSNYSKQVAVALSSKEHISDGINQTDFLHFILLLSLFFVVLSCLFTFLMIRSRIKMNQKKTNESLLTERYQVFLSSFLLLPNDVAFLGIQKNMATDVRLSKRDVTDKGCRAILASEIYELKKMVRGQQESQLCNYFYGLGLQEEVAALLKSRKWTNKAKAMQLIRSFDILELLPVLNQYIGSKNRELSIHSIVARIAIDKNLTVLEELDYQLNSWELHKVYDTIKTSQINLNFLPLLCEKFKEDESHFSHELISVFEQNHAVLEFA